MVFDCFLVSRKMLLILLTVTLPTHQHVYVNQVYQTAILYCLVQLTPVFSDTSWNLRFKTAFVKIVKGLLIVKGLCLMKQIMILHICEIKIITLFLIE